LNNQCRNFSYKKKAGGFLLTAEIGILNRTGVALAADSAVTIGGLNKVYNSANKVFSLSKHHPIGIMIYGGADFMGVPWETIIKTYREILGTQKKDSVKEYCDDFIEFLKTDQRLHNNDAEANFVKHLFRNAFLGILSAVERKINESISAGVTPNQTTVEDWILDISGNFTEKLKTEHNLLPGFPPTFEIDFKTNHENHVNSVIDAHMEFTLRQEVKEQLFELAYYMVASDILSNGYSGVVIAGYGEKEIFPALYDYKIEGFIQGTLKIIENPPTRIAATQTNGFYTSAIKPFAQKDMVASFMEGIDPSLERSVYQILENIMGQFPDLIEKSIQSPLTGHDKDVIKQIGLDILSVFKNEVDKVQKGSFIQPVIDIVDILPKEELAAMAEALVNLTSFKRRISVEAETVGGPVDVAVITKGDGLVWIKRKHYFNPELNYHFFQNYTRE
jgi:hypothetical protein